MLLYSSCFCSEPKACCRLINFGCEAHAFTRGAIEGHEGTPLGCNEDVFVVVVKSKM